MGVDRTAVEAMLAALEGTGKPFVLTSGTALVAPGRVATEDDMPPEGPMRGGTEHVAVAAKDRGVRSSVVRLAPTTHGAEAQIGFLPQPVQAARTTAERAGHLTIFLQMDIPASNAKTRAALGWAPREAGLLDDMRAHYFG